MVACRLDFSHVGRFWRHGKILGGWPQVAAHQGQGVGESGLGFGVPGCGPTGHGFRFLQLVGGQGYPGEEAQQDWRGAGDGPVGPLALGLHTQVGADFSEGYFQLPTQHKPLDDLDGIGVGVGAEQGLGLEPGLGVADQHPADGYRRLAGDVPEGGVGGQCHGAGMAAIPGHRRCGPGGVGMMQQLYQGGLSGADDAGPSPLTGLAGWRRMVETGIQTQAGDETYRLGQGAAALEQVQGGIGAVAYHHQVSVRQPPSQLQDQLSGPIGEFLGLASPSSVVGLRGCQDREQGQGPHPVCPGDLSQPHQGYPAQTAGLDHVAPMGTGRVSVGPFGLDARTSAPLQGLVDAKHQGAVARGEVLQQQPQQDARRPSRRPHRTVEHFVVPSVVVILAAAHDPQGLGHGALARGQDGAHQQQLGFAPGWLAEQRYKGHEYGYNGIGQGEHHGTFRGKSGP